MLIAITTVPDLAEAGSLAEKIVNEKLAACVQILPPMMSVYVWDGAVRRESEHLLLIKTLDDRFEAVRDFILANHSYETPEVIAVKAENLSEGYLAWITDCLTRKEAS
ncbi:MAG TPA: divalent-cation tolerance protein CutA [Pyrinomonadaceae bacterium]